MAGMGTGTADALVGRAREREELAAALAASRGSPGGILVIEGEPGIGKSRLLLELAQIAAGEGCVVLSARASEFERDLPYALWSDAVDGHLRGLGERRVRLLGIADPDALAVVAPVLEGQARRCACCGSASRLTVRCAICSSGWRLRARWCCALTMCIGRIPLRSTRWPRLCAGRRRQPCCWHLRHARVRFRWR